MNLLRAPASLVAIGFVVGVLFQAAIGPGLASLVPPVDLKDPTVQVGVIAFVAALLGALIGALGSWLVARGIVPRRAKHGSTIGYANSQPSFWILPRGMSPALTTR